LAFPLETEETTPSSALATVRLRRRLSIEEAARRSGLSTDELTWLEEGRLYRFAGDEALTAAVLYGAALDISLAEARELAGLPPSEPKPGEGRLRRLAVFAALATAVAALVVALLLTGQRSQTRVPSHAVASLPPPWKVRVDVLNGAGDINWTRQVASRVGALGYRLRRVTRANRFDYPRTAVYYEPGGQALAVRLARVIGTVTSPLPGGSNPRRLVVIVGPHRGPG
jgi:transcriptional regulator with XRE-family HTH domain